MRKEKELQAALKETRILLDASSLSLEYLRAWNEAYIADSKAAAAKGEVFHLGMTGPNLKNLEATWKIKRARLRATVQTLQWALDVSAVNLPNG